MKKKGKKTTVALGFACFDTTAFAANKVPAVTTAVTTAATNTSARSNVPRPF